MIGAHGDCRTSADCGGQPCIGVTDGGYAQCDQPPVPPESCTDGGYDQCCPPPQSPSCPTGELCIGPGIGGTCGGAPPAFVTIGNACASDACQTDADCSADGGEVCTSAGTMGSPVRACFTGNCDTDADCTTYPGGFCAPVKDYCCSQYIQLSCIYVGHGGCLTSTDCGSSAGLPVCVDGTCASKPPICPT